MAELQVTDEMVQAFEDAAGECAAIGVRDGLAAMLAIVERDYDVIPRPTPEQAATYKPKPRLRWCVEAWPGALIEGNYDPRCCRWPKSCSATAYDSEEVTEEVLEDLGESR